MRAFVCSKDRAATISTYQVLQALGVDVAVVVHNQEQFADYLAAGRVPHTALRISNTPADAYGLTRQREYVCRRLADPGEWFIFADDNIHGITVHPAAATNLNGLGIGVFGPRDAQAQARADLATPATPASWQAVTSYLVDVATGCGAHLVGFATNDNPAFRNQHLRTIGYVSGKLMLWHNDPAFDWDHTITMEDYRNSAEHLLNYGAVLVDNWTRPVAGHYEPGGMGTYDERIPYRQRDVQRLLQMYPGFFRVKDRKGFVPGTDLALVPTSHKQLAKLRGLS